MKLFIILYAISYYTTAKVIDVDNDFHKRMSVYLATIRDQVNLTVDPCDDFEAFACGNLVGRENTEFSLIDQIEEEKELLKKNFDDMEPKSSAETLVKTFYNSCVHKKFNPKEMFEQIDSLKAFGTYPVDRKPTEEEIINLMVDLFQINQLGIFGLELSPDQDSIILRAVPVLHYYYDFKSLVHHMSGFDSTPLEHHNVAKKVFRLSFDIEEAAIIRDTVVVEIASLRSLKIIAPDFNWDLFSNILEEKYPQSKKLLKGLRIEDPRLLNRIVAVLRIADKKTLANFLISKFLHFGANLNCGHFLPVFTPMLLRNFFQTTNKADILKHLSHLEHLKTLVTSPKSFKKNKNELLIDIDNLIRVFKNYDEIFQDSELDKYYNSYKMSGDAYYLDSFNFTAQLLERDLVDFHNKVYSIPENEDVIREKSFYDFIVTMFNHNMPIMTFYYFNVNLKVLADYFFKNPQYNEEAVAQCFEKEGIESPPSSLKNFLTAYAANKFAYDDYNFVINENEVTQEDQQLLSELQLNSFERVYFLALAQNNCAYSDTSIQPVLQFMKGFQAAFNCPADSNMNKIDRIQCIEF